MFGTELLDGMETATGVVPVEPQDNTTCGDGKGRCFVGAREAVEGPGECRFG